MIITKSPLGFAIMHLEGKTFLTGYPRALQTQRFWETAHEFETYLNEQELALRIRMMSEPTAFYAVAEQDVLEEFLSELEQHFNEET